MSDSYTVKIQCDLTGERILIYDVPEESFMVEFDGDNAARVIEAYDLKPLTKTYARAEVDEHGLLHLGQEIEDFEEEE